MLASITPVGEEARGRRWATTAGAYVVASTVGGALIGSAAGALGALAAALGVLPTGRGALAVLATAALVGLALDVGDRLPILHRQVNERWLTEYRGWVYGVGFGFQLGLGLVTIVPTSVTYVMLVAAGLTGSVSAAALIGCCFGLIRAVPILLTGRITDPETLRRTHRWLAEVAGPAHRVSLGSQGAVVLAAVSVVAVGP